jgi:hypothetical protein
VAHDALKPLKNRDLWERLVKLEGSLAVSCRHVRGHRPKMDTSDDARYNREVDVPAGEARRANVLSLERQSGIQTTLSLEREPSPAQACGNDAPIARQVISGCCCKSR